jgi:hypothetical protein
VEDNPRFQESDWMLSKQEVEEFQKTIREFLIDGESVDYLEAELEDRSCANGKTG